MKKTGLYRFAQVVVPPFFKLLYRYQVIGRENVPAQGPVILCSNHTCYKDPLFLGLAQKRQVWFMAKQELFKNKFLGRLIRQLGAFPVARSGGMSAIKNALRILKQEGVVGIFIEGTRSKTGELQKPKPGAMLLAYETKAAVVPVDIIGKDGKPPKIFSENIVRIGKPIPFEDLNMEDSSSMQMRRASRVVMEQITALRAQTLAASNDG